jgi:hypothetical protein
MTTSYALPIDHTASVKVEKGRVMWSLIVLIFATSSVASATVTTLEFSTQQLCQMALRELQNIADPVVTAGVATNSLGIAFKRVKW